MPSLHFLVPKCGRNGNGQVKYDKSLLRTNYYVGFAKAFLVKLDTRRSEKMMEKRSGADSLFTYEMQGQLQGFIDLVSKEEALRLLNSAREVKDSSFFY